MFTIPIWSQVRIKSTYPYWQPGMPVWEYYQKLFGLTQRQAIDRWCIIATITSCTELISGKEIYTCKWKDSKNELVVFDFPLEAIQLIE